MDNSACSLESTTVSGTDRQSADHASIIGRNITKRSIYSNKEFSTLRNFSVPDTVVLSSEHTLICIQSYPYPLLPPQSVI